MSEANIYCVRSEFGKYTEAFVKNEYIAIGWLHNDDLSKIKDRDAIHKLYEAERRGESPYTVGQQVGQINRFLLEIKKGDFIITPSINTDTLYWAEVEDGSYVYLPDPKDGCPWPHRRMVKWNKKPVKRSQFSVPTQNTLKASLTCFRINQKTDFFTVIGKPELFAEDLSIHKSNYESVLERILELDHTEFEILITHILRALGFEAQHTGKVGDGGVDVEGELSIGGLAKIKLIVQAKRYARYSKIGENDVITLRQRIPHHAQGAFITTADFRKKALDAAVEQGFPRIGTINGNQLVDLLVQVWSDIPQEFKDILNLKRGLIIQ